MLPDRVSNPGPLTYESGALPIALRGPAACQGSLLVISNTCTSLLDLRVRCPTDCATRPCVACQGFLDWIVLLFYVHGKHLRSCRDGQLT